MGLCIKSGTLELSLLLLPYTCGFRKKKMNNIAKWKKLKDNILGFNSAIPDTIFYLIVLGVGWKFGHPLWGVGIVVVCVVADLYISYNAGKKLEG